MSIYNVDILSVMAVIMSFVLSNHVDLHYALLSSFAIIGTIVTQLIIFMSKVSLTARNSLVFLFYWHAYSILTL